MGRSQNLDPMPYVDWKTGTRFSTWRNARRQSPDQGEGVVFRPREHYSQEAVDYLFRKQA